MILAQVSDLLATYGYVVLLVGTFLEGETVLLVAGYLAQLGYMHLGFVIIFAFLGSVCGDQFFFYLGRRHGQSWLRRHEGWKAGISRVDRMMERFGWMVLLGFRFAYGLRSITPFALGLSALKVRTFVGFNICGALIWAGAVGGVGYLFGSTLEAILERLMHYEHLVAGGVLGVGLIVWLLKRSRKE